MTEKRRRAELCCVEEGRSGDLDKGTKIHKKNIKGTKIRKKNIIGGDKTLEKNTVDKHLGQD